MTRTQPTRHMRRKRIIAILFTPDVQLLDLSGPLDVFAEANVQTGGEVYLPLVIGSVSGDIRSSSGVRLMPDAVIGQRLSERLDTLLVAGAPKIDEAAVALRVSTWRRETALTVRRYGSVCSGAFFLANAGLLDGRRVTTHWAVA